MQNSSQQNRPPMNKATMAGGWAPKAKDFASNRRFLAKQQAANEQRRAASQGKPAVPPSSTTPTAAPRA
jgi:hypothetical protein